MPFCHFQCRATPRICRAVHAAEIEYALGNLDTNPIYQWGEDDYAVSKTMMGFFFNFIKTGDPNGPGLPDWPAASSEANGVSSVMVIDVESSAVPAEMDDRYHLLDRLAEE